MGIFDALKSAARGVFGEPPTFHSADKKVGPEKEAAKARFVSAEVSEASPEHPDRNEDSALVDALHGRLAVADGAGGHGAGDEISQAVIASLERRVKESPMDELVVKKASVEQVNAAMDKMILQVVDDAVAAGKAISAKAEPERVAMSKALAEAKKRGQTKDDAFMKRFAALGKVARHPPMTTLITSQLLETSSGWKAIVKSVGDSAGYIRRKNGKLEAIPVQADSSLLALGLDEAEIELISQAASAEDLMNSLVASGAMDGQAKQELLSAIGSGGLFDMTVVRAHPTLDVNTKQLINCFNGYNSNSSIRISRLNISQALGGKFVRDRIKVHTAVVDLQEGDEIVLASDGLDDNLTRREIEEVMRQGGTLSERLKRAKDRAMARSADKRHLRSKVDDITAVGQEVPLREVKVHGRRQTIDDLRASGNSQSQMMDVAVPELLLAKALAENPEAARIDDQHGDVVLYEMGKIQVPMRLSLEKPDGRIVLTAIEEDAPFAVTTVQKADLGRLFARTADVLRERQSLQEKKAVDDLAVRAKKLAK